MPPTSEVLALADVGFAVIPLRPGGKEPLAGSHGSREASRDERQIGVWFDDHPERNVGIVTGAPSGFLVIDYDAYKEEADASYKRLMEQTGWRLTGLVATTPRGGYHYYYRIPAGHSFRSGPLPGYPGIDVKSDGGYVVAPPSEVGGRRYQWVPV
jgi:hypothetical protein